MGFIPSIKKHNWILIIALVLQNVADSNLEKINSEINNSTQVNAIEKDLHKFGGVENTFELLQLGEVYLDLGDQKDVVLVLGNTGSGKSTLTQFVAGDNTKLRALETEAGTGEFIIIDENNKIGHGIYSKTVFPERVIDPETNIAYYDCPGFSDTRNAAFDIASNYFIKKTIDHIKTVKIVLTISYSSVRVGVDRTDFMKLVKHTNEFIKNIKKFKNSIALIITKVDNEYIRTGKEFSLVPDERIVAKIASYIKNVKQSIQETLDRSTDFSDQIFYKKAIILMDIFLMKDKEDKYRNIVLFRRPDENGLISEVKLLQNGKKSIKNLIEHDMIFVKKTEKDFGFTISDNSKHNIFKLVEKINDEITVDISNTTGEITEYFYTKTLESNDLHALKQEMNGLYKSLLDNRQELLNTPSFKEFLVKFINYINNMDVKSSRQVFLKILKKYKYIEFLQMVSNEKFKAKTTEWTQPLNNVVDYVSESKIWYNFIIDLYEKLSYYKPYTYFSEKIKQNQIQSRQKRNTIHSDFKDLMNDLKEYDIKEYDIIPNTAIDPVKFREINDVMNSVFDNNITHSCPNPHTLIVKGDFIKVSEIGAHSPCSTNIKSVQIFALNTIFIDADIVRIGEEINILIIAPKWEIIGNRKIILDGLSQADDVPPKAALNQDGRPGIPGGSAGSFIGIGQKIVDGHQLTISVNGGTGGRGQEGGDGLPGINGFAQLPYGDQAYGERIMQRSGYRKTGYKDRTVAESFWEAIGYAIGIYHKIETHSYRMFGGGGTKGSDGARGGAGGKGGLAGTISIYGFNYTSKITIFNKKGAGGMGGKGGQGGRGGKLADDVNVDHVVKKTYWFGGKLKSTDRGWYVRSTTYKGRNADGFTNHQQPTTTGIIMPKEAARYKNPAHNIIDYKIYVLENLNDNVKRQGLMEFYFQLNNDSNIKNTYDSFELLYELQSFENKYHRFLSDVELDHFYKSLLNRISEYAVKPKQYEDTINHKKLLNYLYTVTLSKTMSIKNKAEGDLIIDIDSYFNLILEGFSKLKNYENEIVKNEYNQNYKKSIDSKITEAMDFIEKQILPETDIITYKIEQKIEMLVNEIIELQEKTEKEKDELFQKQSELETMIEQRGIFESLKLLSFVSKFFGPIGETVSGVIQQTSKIADSLSLDSNKNNNPDFSLPEGVKTLVENGNTFVEHFVAMKAGALKHLLDSLIDEINKYPNDLKNLSETVTDMKANISEAENHNHLDMVKIISKTEELLEALGKTYNSFKSKDSDSEDSMKTDQKSWNEILNILQIFQKTAHVAELFTDLYLSHKDDTRKLEEIGSAIQKQQLNINLLRQYQLKIYHTIIPMFKTMRTDIIDYEAQIGSKSRVALDVSKWNIQEAFKDMRFILSKITSGFNIHEDLTNFIDKLDEAIGTIITVHDRIQVYNEQKELADYIAEINSAKSNSIKTSNKTINDALVELDLTMKSNLVLAQFEKAIHGFKQFIFPFANYYLEEYHLSPEIELERNLENVVANASRQIENLKSKLTEHDLLLHKHVDEYVYEEHFQSGAKFNGPFIVWDNDKYENIISKLLSGEEIILKANILNTIHEKNAIKFNKIHINFTSRNKHISEELNEKLKSFDVIMKHSGNSYFRCDNNFYLLVSDSQTFYYSFEKSSDGEPVRRNRVYKKIKNGQYMLSPYTTWSIQLKSVFNANFSRLNDLKGLVDLELIGHGQYVSAENKVCGRELKTYYKTADTISVTDIIDFVDSA